METILDCHFDHSGQPLLRGQAETHKARAFTRSKFLHVFKAEHFSDINGAQFERNHIYKASSSPRDKHFESLNLACGGSLGFMIIATDSQTIEKMFGLFHEHFLSDKRELFSYLMSQYTWEDHGFGLEMGIIPTQSPESCFLKILGCEMGPAGFIGKAHAILSKSHPELFCGARIWCEDYHFADYHSYCDPIFEDRFGKIHTDRLFRTLSQNAYAASGLHARDPERFAELTVRNELSELHSETPAAEARRKTQKL